MWSAGNDTTNVDNFANIDRFNLENLISVGAINNSGERSYFLNYGINSVQIFAPGENILNTFPTDRCNQGINSNGVRKCELPYNLPNGTYEDRTSTHQSNGYHKMQGTSMATPHVTGVAALIASKYPDLDATAIKASILGGSDEITINTPDGNQAVRLLRADKALIQAGKIPNFPELSVESASPQWMIRIHNTNDSMQTISYNERMCFENDAKNFFHLTNLRSFKLSSNGYRTVQITPFGTASTIAVAIPFGLDNGDTIYRVSYAYNISANNPITVKHYTVSGGALGEDVENAALAPNYLDFKITARYGTIAFFDWDVDLINNNPVPVSVTYNSKMCFDDASRNFMGLKDLVDITIPANSRVNVRIGGNGTAYFITAAINFTIDGVRYRRISSAKDLAKHSETDYSIGALRNNEVVVSASFPELNSHPDYLTLNPVSRAGWPWVTWGIKIINNSASQIEVSYNAKACFENNAKDFIDLADIVTITIPANSSSTVIINHNGTADHIVAAINYSYGGYEYRKITYACNLGINPSRANQKYNTVRFTF